MLYCQFLRPLGDETQARSVFQDALAQAERFNVTHEEELDLG